ncbi:hypothetical protein DOTSEDRAFT_33771 [Dothistroma septosporum NZE10]|uniref:Uncharacterized protein n=1 Tax=Dothistroma septosporum (strain NZE10 / CBS 128990) TaxID=675120 RepID=N1PP63_DOTSN|nr:hypothetical protein DOTSEDRAFT_33771 [Dothistroma septosporum NZE10]
MPSLGVLPVNVRLPVCEHFYLDCSEDTWTTTSASTAMARRYDGFALARLFAAMPSLWPEIDLLKVLVLRDYLLDEQARRAVYPALAITRNIFEHNALQQKMSMDLRQWGIIGTSAMLNQLTSTE